MNDVSQTTSNKRDTAVERISDRELRVTRTFDAPAHVVFAAWTTPAVFLRWWAPKSMGMSLHSCEMDVRKGGKYSIAFDQDGDVGAQFFGRYVEVVPNQRLIWTNEEGEDGAVTTVTFEEAGGQTLLTFHELYPTKEALDEALIGMDEAMPEQFEQLDDVIADAAMTTVCA